MLNAPIFPAQGRKFVILTLESRFYEKNWKIAPNVLNTPPPSPLITKCQNRQGAGGFIMNYMVYKL